MTPHSETDSRRGQATALALLFAAGVINFFDRTALSVANTTVRGELHLSGAAMGWLLSAFSLAYGLGQLPLVSLLQRASTRTVLGAGMAVWSVAQLLTGFAGALPAFLAWRVVLGLGESPFYPCAVQIVRQWFPERSRGRATAVMSMSQTIGLTIAPPLLVLLLVHFGWRVMFMVLGVAGLLAAAAWWVWYRAPSSEETTRPTAVHGTGWSLLLQRRTVWGMMLGFGGINYTVWLYTAWLPGYLQEARHLSLARTGWLASVPFLAGALGMFTSGVVADRRQRAQVALTRVHRANLVLGMVLSAASTFVVARSGTTLTAVAGISAALFFVHFAGTSGWGYVQTVAAGRLVASLGALQNFASFVIASLAPVLTGWLLDRTHSFSVALGVCTVVTLLGAVSYATLAAPDEGGVIGAVDGAV